MLPKKLIPPNSVDAVAPFSFGSRDTEESRPPISLGFSATFDMGVEPKIGGTPQNGW